jgi:hypothetical protein
MACFFGQNIGTEDIEHEYKEFTMDFSNRLSQEHATQLVKSSKWIFNHHSINSLFDNVRTYLPRYIAGFMCKESETDQGSLHIGIGDNGIVYGIPYCGDLVSDIDFADMISKVIEENIKCDNIDIIKQNMAFDIVKLDYNATDIANHCPSVDKYLEIIREREIALEHTQGLYDSWCINFDKYMTRLTYLFNDPETRQELYEYIEHHDPNSSILGLIKSNYILEHLSHDALVGPKQDPMTPYYWVCRWKDELVQKIIACKPKVKYTEYKPHMSSVKILQSVRSMIPYWMQNNKNMNLYVIKFSFRKPLNKQLTISYKDILGNIVQCYRTLKYTPCCMPF